MQPATAQAQRRLCVRLPSLRPRLPLTCWCWCLYWRVASLAPGTGPLPLPNSKAQPRRPGLEILEIKVSRPDSPRLLLWDGSRTMHSPQLHTSHGLDMSRRLRHCALQDDFIKFVLSDTDISMANSLRRSARNAMRSLAIWRRRACQTDANRTRPALCADNVCDCMRCWSFTRPLAAF